MIDENAETLRLLNQSATAMAVRITGLQKFVLKQSKTCFVIMALDPDDHILDQYLHHYTEMKESIGGIVCRAGDFKNGRGYTVNSENIVCIYYWQPLNGDDNACFIFGFSQGVTQQTRKFWNVSSNYCDYNLVTIFANITIISAFTVVQ